MKKFMFLLALGLVTSEKLDRTYLPPPGSKYSGGEPGDLQAPLEYPKDAYTTTTPFEPGQKNQGLVTIGDTQLVPGSNRGTSAGFPGFTKDIIPVTPANKPANFFQYKVPTTTTSYAFTQTTTFPPPEGFDTTPSPILPGYSVDGSISNQPGFINQPFNQGQVFNQPTGPIRPGFQPGIQFPQRSGLLTEPGLNVHGIQSIPNQNVNDLPGYAQAQNFNQYQGFPASTVSPISSSAQPGPGVFPSNQGYTEHLGVQPPRQSIQQGYPSYTATPGYQTDLPSQYNKNIPNAQGTINEQRPIYPTVGTTQYVDEKGNIRNTLPSYFVPQQEGNLQQVGDQVYVTQPGQNGYGGDNMNSVPGTLQQGVQSLQPIGPQVSVQPNVVGTGVGYIPGQQQATQRPQFIGQQDSYQSGFLQGNNVPNKAGVQQQEQKVQLNSQQQRPVLPSTGQQGFITNQGDQRPQFIDQQINFPSFGVPNVTGPPMSFVQSQKGQRPQYGEQQIQYPSDGTGIVGQQPIGQQSSFGSQQSSYSPEISPQSLTPGNVPQQGGQAQNIGQQGSLPSISTLQGSIPSGQLTYQRPGKPQGQQALIPSTSLPQGSTQQPGTLTPGSSMQQEVSSGQQQFTYPGTQENLSPTGQSQISSQQYSTARPADQGITAGVPQNIYKPESSTPSYQQSLSPSTTPSSISPYGTTPSVIIPSSTPGYSNAISSAKIRSRPERPQTESDRNAVILNYESELALDGYAYSFDTSNGIHADENGTTIQGTKAEGSYSYVGDDGKLYSVMYTADENGFRPHGDHLPTPPPVPEAIQRIIDQAVKDKEAGISHDGFYDEAKYGHKKYQGPTNRHPETQDRIYNGAYIPDDYESNFKENDKQKKYRPKGERKPASFAKDEQYSSGYEKMDNESGFDLSNVNKNDMIIKPFNRKMPSRRPVTKRPGNTKYESDRNTEIDKKREQQILGIRTDDKRSQQPGGDSSRYRPGPRKPVSPKDRYKEGQSYDDKMLLEEDGGSSYEPSQVNDNYGNTASKFSKEQESSQRTKLPGQFDSNNEKPLKELSYPGVQLNDDLQQSIDRYGMPQKPGIGASNNFGTNYYATDDQTTEPELPDQRDSVTGKPIGTRRPGYESTRYTKPNRQQSQIGNLGTHYPDGIKFKQKERPQYNQRTEDSDFKYPEQNEDDGYQYTPPQLKFDLTQGKGNKFPSRFSDRVTTVRPTTKYETTDYKTTVQPFITPNVHRDEDDSYEDVSEESKPSQKFEKGTVTTVTPEYEDETTDNNLEYLNEQNESDGDQGDDEKITSEKITPEKPLRAGQTRRPGYQTQKPTSVTQNYDQNMSGDGDVPKRRLSRPGKKDSNRYLPISSNKIQGRPEQEYLQDNEGNSKSPNYTYVTSTPLPSRRPNLPGSKRPSQQEEEQFRNPTTYEPSSTSSTEDDYAEDTPGLTITNKESSRRPGTKPGSHIGTMNTSSSTKVQPGSPSRPTSRPSYDYSEERTIPGAPTIRPGLSESTFGGSSVRPGSSRRPSYSTTTISESSRPETASTLPDTSSTSVDRYYSQKKPNTVTFPSRSDTPEPYYADRTTTGVVTDSPGTSQYPGQRRIEGLPSTTYRPNYSITSISQPSSDSVDNFGRPVQGYRAPVNQYGQYGNIRPGNSVTLGQDSPATERPSTFYENAVSNRPGQSGSQVQSFKPNEPRFGGSIQGGPGTKPAEFGPSSVTTPGYLEPYGPSTQKVIGEDFSGPKQPQKFDPETGYYY